MHRRAHGRLNVKHLDVLPVLLEKRDKEVHGELHVEGNVSRGHGDVGNGKRHAHHLLHLELDGSLDGVDLLLQVLVLIKKRGELTSLGEARTKNTRDLLDEGGRGKEVVVLLGEFLDELLVLVELLEVVNSHLVYTELISLLAVLLVTKNAHAGVGLGDHGKAESAAETFVSLGIIVLEGDLELDRFSKLSLLALLILSLVGYLFAICEF